MSFMQGFLPAYNAGLQTQEAHHQWALDQARQAFEQAKMQLDQQNAQNEKAYRDALIQQGQQRLGIEQTTANTQAQREADYAAQNKASIEEKKQQAFGNNLSKYFFGGGPNGADVSLGAAIGAAQAGSGVKVDDQTIQGIVDPIVQMHLKNNTISPFKTVTPQFSPVGGAQTPAQGPQQPTPFGTFAPPPDASTGPSGASTAIPAVQSGAPLQVAKTQDELRQEALALPSPGAAAALELKKQQALLATARAAAVEQNAATRLQQVTNTKDYHDAMLTFRQSAQKAKEAHVEVMERIAQQNANTAQANAATGQGRLSVMQNRLSYDIQNRKNLQPYWNVIQRTNHQLDLAETKLNGELADANARLGSLPPPMGNFDLYAAQRAKAQGDAAAAQRALDVLRDTPEYKQIKGGDGQPGLYRQYLDTMGSNMAQDTTTKTGRALPPGPQPITPGMLRPLMPTNQPSPPPNAAALQQQANRRGGQSHPARVDYSKMPTADLIKRLGDKFKK